MDSAAIVWPVFNSLQAFWPGLQVNSDSTFDQIVNIFQAGKFNYAFVSMFLSQKVLAGDVDPAIRTHTAFFSVWKRYGFTPEGFNLATLSVQVLYLNFKCLCDHLSLIRSDGTMMLQLHIYSSFSLQYGQKSYPLRPELIESTYWLYKATRDPRSPN